MCFSANSIYLAKILEKEMVCIKQYKYAFMIPQKLNV